MVGGDLLCFIEFICYTTYVLLESVCFHLFFLCFFFHFFFLFFLFTEINMKSFNQIGKKRKVCFCILCKKGLIQIGVSLKSGVS